MESLLIFCLDFFITVIAYLLVPITLCICRKKFTLSRIKLIAIVNGICVWLIFMIILINTGKEGASGAVLLWSTVAYFLMKKYCLKNLDNSKPIEENKPIKKYVVTQVKKADLANTQTQKPKKKKLPLIFVIVALSILLIGSVTYNVIQYTIIQKRTEGIKYLEENVLSEYITIYDEDNTSLGEGSDTKSNSFNEEFLRLIKEKEKISARVYGYDPETHKYLDADGKEYRKQN